MNILTTHLICLLLLTAPALAADSAPPALKDPIGDALPLLQAKYVDFKELNFKLGDNLNALIARSGGKISLVAPETTSTPIPILTANLPDGVVYWRLATFDLPVGKAWPDLVAQLKQPSVQGIILDLRSNTFPDDYAGANNLRTILGPVSNNAPHADAAPEREPVAQLFGVTTVVLTNDQTSGAAEALAGFLQADGALVVGGTTAGKVAVFEEDKLPSGQILRYAVAPSTGSDPAQLFQFRGETPAWGHPVIPDIPVTVDARSERAALTLIKDNHIDEVIQELPERHRLNEATLVKGQDPEWDDYLSSLEQKPVLLSLPVIHDAALVRGLDSLKAIRLSERTIPTQTTANASLPTSTSVQ